MRALAITVSNRAAAGVYEDRSGPVLARLLAEAGFTVDGPLVVPDGEPVEAAGAGAPRASGTLGRHYAPRTPLRLVASHALDAEIERAGPGVAVLAFSRPDARAAHGQRPRSAPAKAPLEPRREPLRCDGRPSEARPPGHGVSPSGAIC